MKIFIYLCVREFFFINILNKNIKLICEYIYYAHLIVFLYFCSYRFIYLKEQKSTKRMDHDERFESSISTLINDEQIEGKKKKLIYSEEISE